MDLTETTLGATVSDKRNANRGTDRGRRALRQSLERYGAGRSILLARDGTILAGNKTAQAAGALGLDALIVVETDGTKLVAVRRTDLDPESAEARELALADNRVGALDLDFDPVVIDEALKDGLELSALWTGDELEELLRSLEPAGGFGEGVDPDAIPEAAPPRCKPGELWACGRHRILCGDSTNPEHVARLMDGRRAEACITDPPYSVEYDRSQTERGGDEQVHQAYQEGDPRATEILAFLHCLPTDVLVMTYPVDRHFFALASVFQACRMEFRKELVWVKDSFSFWPGAQYQQRHEPILVCARKGHAVGSDVPANQSTVFEFPRPRAHDLHPTARPVDLWAKLVEFHIRVGGAVYDPFSGSGTTIIAAHQTGRTCYAMEIAPQYVDTAVARFEQVTGEQAVRL